MADANASRGMASPRWSSRARCSSTATPRSASASPTRAGYRSCSPPACTPTSTSRSPSSTATRTSRRDLRPRDRARHPGDRDQAGLHQVRRRRAGRQPEHREDPPRCRARLDPDGPPDHGPLAAGQRDRPRADADLRRGGRRRSKVQVAHTGDTDDLDYIERLLDTGCWIGMDRYGLDIFLPTEQRQKTVLTLLEEGHVERMFLSQDYCSTIDWFPPEVQDPERERGARLVHDVPFREGDPRVEGTRDVRRAARTDDGREPQTLVRLLDSAHHAGVV